MNQNEKINQRFQSELRKERNKISELLNGVGAPEDDNLNIVISYGSRFIRIKPTDLEVSWEETLDVVIRKLNEAQTNGTRKEIQEVLILLNILNIF